MITESVVCVILHCSRCNIPFRDDSDDDWAGVAHWESNDEIAEQFNNPHREHGGWRRFGDRYVCSDCQVSTGDSEGFADDPNARENPNPLPAAKADRVARAQAVIAQAERHIVEFDERGWTIMHPLSCRPDLFTCPVSKAAQNDLKERPAELGRFVCEVDPDGRFTVHQRITEGEVTAS